MDESQGSQKLLDERDGLCRRAPERSAGLLQLPPIGRDVPALTLEAERRGEVTAGHTEAFAG